MSQSLTHTANKARRNRPADSEPESWLTMSFSFTTGRGGASDQPVQGSAAPSINWLEPKPAGPSWSTSPSAEPLSKTAPSAFAAPFRGTAVGAVTAQRATGTPGAAPAPAGERHAPSLWTGPGATPVTIDGRDYRVAFAYVGPQAADSSNPCVIDPTLDVARGERLAQSPGWFTPYADLTPQERSDFLEWHDRGRAASDAPPGFRLLFLSSLEHAIIRDQRVEHAPAVLDELERLIAFHANDHVFVKAATNLVTACNWLNDSFVPPVISPTAAANYQSAIPFSVLHFLGHTLRASRKLEAGDALLWYLQQPGTRLEPATAQHFREMHAAWCHRFPYDEAGEFEIPQQTPRLSLEYQPIFGDFDSGLPSDLPDLAAVPVPAAFHALFEQCVDDIAPLKGQPVGGPPIILPIFDAGYVQKSTCLEVRPGGGERLAGRLSGPDASIIGVADLLAELFVGTVRNPTHILKAGLVRQMSSILEDAGVAYEPDMRFELPILLRPDRKMVLFRADSGPFGEPSEAYLLAQTAVILSMLAVRWFPTIAVLPIDSVEARLPFRHRFTELEFRRLDATKVAIGTVDNGRHFLERWITILSRRERLDDIHRGFGLAFRGQRKNVELKKFAKAIANVCRLRLNEDDLLEATSASAAFAHGPVAVPQLHKANEFDPELGNDKQSREEDGESNSAPPVLSDPRIDALEGLAPRDAGILLAVLGRPRSIAEFTEFARARGVSAAGAADRINDWGRERLGLDVLDYGEVVAVLGRAVEPLHELLASA